MQRTRKLRRFSYGLSLAVFAAAVLAPAFISSPVSAYGLLATRSVQLSSSANGSLTAGQDVTYKVKFNVATDTTDVGGILVMFCSNSPIIGDSCTAPSGFDVNEGSVALTLVQGITGFTMHANTTANKYILTNGSADNPGANETYEFDLGTAAASDGVTNPTNVNTSFYARILTYDTAANAAAGDPTTLTGGTGTIDAGGIALSTASQVTIQSKVQERLTFCIYTGSGPCPGSMTNPVTLGDTNGVLDPAVSYTTSTSANGNPKFGLSSNAGGGVVVRMKGGTLKRTLACADGTGQNCSINPIGGTAAAPATSSEQFGVRLLNPGATITATAPYTAAGNYAFDDNSTDGTQSTYGDQVASMAAAAEESSELQFVGNIAATTESGIYSTTLTFIATGTY